jgi:hypothetical protein
MFGGRIINFSLPVLSTALFVRRYLGIGLFSGGIQSMMKHWHSVKKPTIKLAENLRSESLCFAYSFLYFWVLKLN